MRYLLIGLSVSLICASAFCACGTGGTSTGSGGAGGGISCQEIALVGDPCDTCLRQQCCSELVACLTAPKCFYCSALNASAEECLKDPHRQITVNMLNCGTDRCPSACGGKYDPDASFGGP